MFWNFLLIRIVLVHSGQDNWTGVILTSWPFYSHWDRKAPRNCWNWPSSLWKKISIRVTRLVCERNMPKCSQTHSCQEYFITFTVEKIRQTFGKTAQSKQSPNVREFAQSDHPDLNKLAHKWNGFSTSILYE
jgi:hypothetical protein